MTDDDWIVETLDDDYPEPGVHALRLDQIQKGNWGHGARYLWVWAFLERPGLTFGVLTTQSIRRSNALGLFTALNDGTRPTPPFDPRSFVGRTVRAKTARKPNGYPRITAVRPTDAASTYVYDLQTKKAATN